MTADAPSSECCPNCPHLESVSGACDHPLRQALAREFVDHPDDPCPMYVEAREEAMSDLARRLEGR
ncbi:MAG: hypothetical protein ABEJ04_00605 [Halobacteriaceae archaeon]